MAGEFERSGAGQPCQLISTAKSEVERLPGWAGASEQWVEGQARARLTYRAGNLFLQPARCHHERVACEELAPSEHNQRETLRERRGKSVGENAATGGQRFLSDMIFASRAGRRARQECERCGARVW